jgi:hypothetical protein
VHSYCNHDQADIQHINENMQCSDMPISLLQSYLFLHAIVDVLQISSKVQRSSIIRMVPPRIELASSHIFHLAGTASKMEYVRGCQSNSNRVPGLARRQPCHNRLFSEVQHEVFKGKKKITDATPELKIQNGAPLRRGFVVSPTLPRFVSKC